MSRKNVSVALVLFRANRFLCHSDPSQRGERLGVASLLECVLHDSGNYAGYVYTDGAHGDLDDSRRCYLVAGRLVVEYQKLELERLRRDFPLGALVRVVPGDAARFEVVKHLDCGLVNVRPIGAEGEPGTYTADDLERVS